MLRNLFKHWSYRFFAPGDLLREKYEAMKSLLHLDAQCHEEMAELQELLYGQKVHDFCRVRKMVACFSTNVAMMIEELNTMSPGQFSSLREYHKKFDFYTRFLLASPEVDDSPPFLYFLENITGNAKDIGSKALQLALLKRKLQLRVPNSFVINTAGYHHFVSNNDLRPKIEELLEKLDFESTEALKKNSSELQKLILEAQLPQEIEKRLAEGAEYLQKMEKSDVVMAVRSCALMEDGKYSFAGQYLSELGVTKKYLGLSYKKVLASKFSPESLYYRASKGIQDEEAAMSVLVQVMVPAKKSGILYTGPIQQNTKNASDGSLFIHVTRELGDKLANGEVYPTVYVVDKSNPGKITHQSGEKLLSDEQVSELIQCGLTIENYFETPQDIEWAISEDDELFILQARSLQQLPAPGRYPEVKSFADRILIDGCECGSSGIASGPVHVIQDSKRVDDVVSGAVLVTKETPPSFAKILHKLAAVIAEQGSRASHFATVAREFGIPYICGVTDACTQLQVTNELTVDGNVGTVYSGKIEQLLKQNKNRQPTAINSVLREAFSFLIPLGLLDPGADNFTPEGCRSMHDIVRFCHEKAIASLFSEVKPGTGRGAKKLDSESMLDVYIFDVGGGCSRKVQDFEKIPMDKVRSTPFLWLWRGLSHPGVQWKQKPFDWEAYDKIELSGGVPPKRDSIVFASYAALGRDYMHFNIRFGYHFTIIDTLCGEKDADNHCMIRFAGGGADFTSRSLRIDFLAQILYDLQFQVTQKGDLLEARLQGIASSKMEPTLDMLGRLLGAAKLMDMVLEDEKMVEACVQDFHNGVYSFSEEG